MFEEKYRKKLKRKSTDTSSASSIFYGRV